MKVIEDHGLNEVILTRVLRWKWVSFIGTPVRGTVGYPSKCRVRQLLSPEQLKSPEWIGHLDKLEAREADGTEPLAYAHGSSQGLAVPPRILLLVDEP